MERIETGIYRRDDGRLCVRTTATDPYTGKIRERSKVLDEGAEIEDAREEIAKLKRRVETAERAPQVVTTTVGDYAVYWAEAKVGELKPSVKRGYVRAMLVLAEYMGAMPIASVVRADIANWVRSLEQMKRKNGKPYSTHTVRGWYRIARIMFRDAVADGLLHADPCTRVAPPTTAVTAAQERDTLSAAELGALVAATLEHQPARYAEVVTLAYTGMRSGELYGLAWDAIDFTTGRIEIRQAVSNRVLVSTTKTGSPRETYAPDVVLEALRSRPRTHDLVFPSDEGTPRGGDTLRRTLDIAAEKAGVEIRVTPQVLRRTFNTLLVELGVDRIVQRAMMGHTTEQMTERYSGVRLDQKRAAVLRLIEGGGKG